MHTCNPSTREAEAGGLWVQGRPGQHSKTLSLKRSGEEEKEEEENNTLI